MADKPLLLVDDLVLYFRTTTGVVRAVDHVNSHLITTKPSWLWEIRLWKEFFDQAILRLLPRNVDTYSGKVYFGR